MLLRSRIFLSEIHLCGPAGTWCVIECAVRFELICAIVHPPNWTCSNVPLETDNEGEHRTLRRPSDSTIQSQQARRRRGPGREDAVLVRYSPSLIQAGCSGVLSKTH
jgi:hypothetical protein